MIDSFGVGGRIVALFGLETESGSRTLVCWPIRILSPILWDPTDPQYKMGKKKLDFWTEISKELKLDVNEVKKKMDSLLASFRRERQREASSGRSGAGTDEIYHSKWFAFEEMKFLNDKFKPRITKDTIDVSNFFYLYLIGPRL
ncbi:hypothetical protein QTP88_010011 [Uroleucon formosanum]